MGFWLIGIKSGNGYVSQEGKTSIGSFAWFGADFRFQLWQIAWSVWPLAICDLIHSFRKEAAIRPNAGSAWQSGFSWCFS